jgi:hypothetical protein
MDGTIPRGQLPEVLRRMNELAEHHGLRVANVFHAGDGNLHPLILYDATSPAKGAGRGIRGRHPAAVRRGRRVLTGEHGVGVEKRDLMPVMFTETDLDQQQRVKCAFDRRAAESRQGLPHAASLRRTRPRARPRRPDPLPRAAALLMSPLPAPTTAEEVARSSRDAAGAGRVSWSCAAAAPSAGYRRAPERATISTSPPCPASSTYEPPSWC